VQHPDRRIFPMRKALPLFVVLSLAGSLWAADPFTGTWVLNLSKSKIPAPFTPAKSQIVHLAINGTDFEIREEVVTDSDEKLIIHAKAQFDGKDYPITGTPAVDTIAAERVDRNTIKNVWKKDGKVVMQETAVVSPDGKRITGTYSITDATGNLVTAIAVFEKK
jgi:hypothetical protein